MADDCEEKLPTSAEGCEDKQEEKPETVIVDCDGGIIVYSRLPDGTLDEGREFSDSLRSMLHHQNGYFFT